LSGFRLLLQLLQYVVPVPVIVCVTVADVDRGTGLPGCDRKRYWTRERMVQIGKGLKKNIL
jgi:hypothetical protein